jgi:hypothetical protein
MDRRSEGGVFISYSHRDREIVSAAARLLRSGGATVFQDIADIKPGTRWKAALFQALDQCERVMVFWSSAAASSEWVEREWRSALEANKQIVPMLLDDTPLPPPLSDFQGVPDMLEMLHSAMRLGAQDGRSRRETRLFAVIGSMGTLIVVMGVWMAVYLERSSAIDASRGATNGDPQTILGMSAYAWGLMALLAMLLVLALTLYARARRRSARTSNEVDSARSPEFSAIGTRFTRAVFNEPPDTKS